MDPHHRKVDLQCPEDLLYLKNNIFKSAQEKLDLHIPPSAAPKDGEDEYRKKVEEMVHQYINDTLLMALPSVAINGLEASPSLVVPEAPSDPTHIDPNDPNYEPYNPKLAQRLRELYATVEAETTRSAELRREAPATAAQGYVERLKAELQAQDEAWDKTRQEVLETADGGLGDWQLPRSEEMKDTWQRASSQLDGLKGIPRDVERLERAKKAAVEVEGT